MSTPVIIAKYNPKWPELFTLERERIFEKLGKLAIQVEHIGSTAVLGLGAKPIIDIMVGIENLNDAEKCISLLEEIYYFFDRNRIEDFPEQRSLDKLSNDTKILLYIVKVNTDYWKRNILFRDYLRIHPEIAKEYNELKMELVKKYKNNQIAYTEGKASFIKKVKGKASKERKKYTS